MSSRLQPGKLLRSITRRADFLLFVLVLALGCVLMARYGSVPAAGDVELEYLPATPPETETVQDEATYKVRRAGPPARFLMYNVQNYFVAGEKSRSRFVCKPKPVKEREAVAAVIASAAPDIVGIIEIGGELALADLCEKLAERGLVYPHTLLLAREGEDRAQALLSRYPIVEDNSRRNQPLHGGGRRMMLRGILDATVELPDGRRFRFCGVHLKSRVGEEGATLNQRKSETRTLAFHVHEILRRQPAQPLVVYGDWNDGPNDESMGILKQGLGQHSGLSRVTAADSGGDEWTLYFRSEKVYYVFDQILVNTAMRKRRARGCESGIVDIPTAAQASDHRAVWCDLR